MVTRAPISVQLYSVRDAIAEDLPSSLARIAELGFTNVEPYGFVDRADEYAAELQRHGLAAPSGHAPVLQYEDPRVAFEAAAKLGMTTVIDPHHPREHWQTLDDVVANAERMNEVGAIAKEFGLSFGYHNHEHEIQASVEGTTALQAFAKRLSPDVVLEVDTFWVSVGGASAPEVLRDLGDRVRYIHVKDGPLTRDTITQQPAGQGEVDVRAVLAAAPNATRVLEFDAYDGDVFAALAESLAYVVEVDA